MANQITGTVLLVGRTESIPTNNGQPFYKRELVLDASRYDQFSGRKFENYPKFEFVGNNCAMLDQFPVGSIVTVSFVLSGRKVEKNGEVSFFTNVTGYKIEPYVRNGMPVNQGAQAVSPAPPSQFPTQGAQTSQQGPYVPPTAPTGPTSQPFPPAVDENGNPINGDPDDLPF